jgi:hypothetical protein
MSKYEKLNFPDWFYFEILPDDKDLYKSWIKSFQTTNKEQLKKTIALPNFDFKVFQKITGITKKMIMEKLK